MKASRNDRPLMNTKQTQCPVCYLMFSSDSACELHKSYRRPETKECKDPSGLGMVSDLRKDGVAVWSVPMDPAVRERMEKMWAARRKS